MSIEEIKIGIKNIDEILRSVRSMNPGDIVVVDYPNFRDAMPRILDHMKLGVYIEARIFDCNLFLLSMAIKCRDARFKYLNVSGANYQDFAKKLMAERKFEVLIIGAMSSRPSIKYSKLSKEYVSAVDTLMKAKPSLN